MDLQKCVLNKWISTGYLVSDCVEAIEPQRSSPEVT